MTFLIFWEEIPEHTYIYFVNVDDPERIAAIRRCHGKFINLTEMDPETAATIHDIPTFARKIYDSTSEDQDIPLVIGKMQLIVTGFAL